MTPFSDPLQSHLIDWAITHLPKAVDVIELHILEPEYVLACLGRLFQRRFESDHAGFYWVLKHWDKDFLALSPYIGTLKLQYKTGYLTLPAPGMTWAAYIKAMNDLDGMTAAEISVPVELSEVAAEPERIKPVAGLFAA